MTLRNGKKPKKNPCLTCGHHVPDLASAWCRECWEGSIRIAGGVDYVPPYDEAGSDEAAELWAKRHKL